MRRLATLLVAPVALVATTLAPVQPAAASDTVIAGRSAWVAVSVARLWQSPSSPRAVDAPALTAPAHIRAWLRAMSLDQRRALSFHSDTEALMGERVVVRRVSGSWAKVVVPDQPTPKDAGGYPGWVPVRQLTGHVIAVRTPSVATVVRRTTWLRRDVVGGAKLVEISSGTTLSYLGRKGDYVRVRTPIGVVRRIWGGAVVVHGRGTPALPRGRGLVTTAKNYLGEGYLWGGLSGFGVDCSGLTWLSHRLHGTLIPRDALPQSRHGTRVASSNLRAGDLVFYATNGLVHHVAMYAGSGQMVEAPHTGAVVRVVPMRWSGYAGARRY